MENQDDNVLLSVILSTYNHEHFFARAIESVLMQKTDFDYQIIIAEDCSTDNTREIIKSYEEKYPGRFEVIRRDKNVGLKQNIYEGEALAKGKYEAILECDDFWRDPNKLQYQVDFLESNPDYSICYHDGNMIDPEENILREHEYDDDVRKDWNETEMISGKGFATTNSALFRNLCADDHKNYDVLNFDTLRWHLLGFHGKCKYMDHILPSAYRIHAGGVWSLLAERNKLLNLLNTLSVIRNNIIEKCGKDSEELKLHDQIYYGVFSSFFIDSIKNKSLSDYLFCFRQLLKHKKLEAILIFGYSFVRIGDRLLFRARNKQ